MPEPQKRKSVVRDAKGRIVPGSGAIHPGGRPKKLVEIEAMLDAEHRTVANMRDVFARLKALAMGEVVEVLDKDGAVVGLKLASDARFMDLYLNRILGPVKELKVDMSDWPDEMVAFFADKVAN